MTKKSRLLLGVVCIILVVAAAGGYYYYWSSEQAKPVIYRSGVGGCPSGYINYGMPLGCITKQQYDDCSRHSCPVCLSSGTEIDTDKGYVRVTALRSGDMVWSVDGNGLKVLVPIVRTTRRAVPPDAQLLSVTLEDGRHLLVSPNHPTAGGELFKSVALEEMIDGSKVGSLAKVTYMDGYTYDLLPDSPTGNYWANGILVGSTLKQ